MLVKFEMRTFSKNLSADLLSAKMWKRLNESEFELEESIFSRKTLMTRLDSTALKISDKKIQ